MHVIATWFPTISFYEYSELEEDPLNFIFYAEAQDTFGPLTVSNYGYSISPEPSIDIFDFVVNSSNVQMTADGLLGLFPINWVDYRLNDIVTRVTDWADVPVEADEIISFLPNTIPYIDYVVTITAEADGEEIQSSWTFRIIPDWTAGRDKLIAEVNARS